MYGIGASFEARVLPPELPQEKPALYLKPPPPEWKYSVLPELLDHAKKYEGFAAVAYVDKHGKGNPLTVGYGATDRFLGRKIVPGMRVTQEEAERDLRQRLGVYMHDTYKPIRNPKLNNYQMNALTDLRYNLGPTGFRRQKTLLDMVRENPYNPAIRDTLLTINKANGKTLKGLTKRRKGEADMYFYQTPVEKALLSAPIITDNNPYLTQSSSTEWHIAR